MSAFVTSDLHLGHQNMLSFVKPDGTLLRPFSCLEEMHEVLIDNHNKIVKKKDRLYILGDVAISRQALELLDRFNGEKVLIRGNHDIFKLHDYAKYFVDIRGAFFRNGLIFTHIPVHPSTIQRGYTGNVHGHLHCHKVKKIESDTLDRRYFNACLEVNDFKPVPIENIRLFFEANQAN